MVGDPAILFMDEPTTGKMKNSWSLRHSRTMFLDIFINLEIGVDPCGRRKLWDIIKQIKKAGQSVVLSSHRYHKISDKNLEANASDRELRSKAMGPDPTQAHF